MIRALVLTPVPYKGASTRFRIAQYAPYLESQGISLTIDPFYTTEFFDLLYRRERYARKAALFLRSTLSRIGRLLNRGRFDLVFISREAYPIGPALFESALAASGIPLVYDFDDAVFLDNTSEANRWAGALKYPRKIASVIARCTEVIAGNEYLAAYARQYNPSVSVIPTSVDTTVFAPRVDVPPPGTPPVIGWIGTPTTALYVSAIEATLQELSRTHRFTFRFCGSTTRREIPGVTVDNVPWSLEREVALFNTCDIGVYPLPDDDWSRGKCGFKAIQFMACGVPVVAGAVGVNRDIIQDGVNGFLASTPQEWRDKLNALLADEGLRRRIGEAGRRRIIEGYSLEVNAPRLAAVLQRALVRGGAAARTAEAREARS